MYAGLSQVQSNPAAFVFLALGSKNAAVDQNYVNLSGELNPDSV